MEEVGDVGGDGVVVKKVVVEKMVEVVMLVMD